MVSLASEQRLNLLDNIIGCAHVPQDLSGDRVPIKQNGKENVLTANVGMAKSPSLLTRSQLGYRHKVRGGNGSRSMRSRRASSARDDKSIPKRRAICANVGEIGTSSFITQPAQATHAVSWRGTRPAGFAELVRVVDRGVGKVVQPQPRQDSPLRGVTPAPSPGRATTRLSPATVAHPDRHQPTRDRHKEDHKENELYRYRFPIAVTGDRHDKTNEKPD